MRRAFLVLIGLFAATGTAAGVTTGAFAANTGKPMNDPYIWLEDVHGEKPLAWVKDQNAKSLGVLKSDPRYQSNYDFILKVLDAKDRIPYGALDHQYVYNFWQDAEHPKGIWRRTTITDYANAEPKWDVLIDVDKLAADEKENWVWKGAQCSPTQTRCLVNLSRGGGDAVVVREFDLGAKSFAKEGFNLKDAKSSVVLLDDNTVLFGTDFGAGSMTTSGYPNVVKLWKRGEKIEEAKTQFEGKLADVASSGSFLRDGDTVVPYINRSPSFFEAENYLQAGGTWWKIPLPLDAELRGLSRGQLLITVRDAWTAPDGTKLGKGALFSVPLKALQDTRKLPPVTVLYTPGPRSTIDGVATGRDAVYVAILDNVVGHIMKYSYGDTDVGDGWVHTPVDLPPGGSAHIISTNDFGPEAYFSFESFLKPPTLYSYDSSRMALPKEIKSLPPRFDADGLEMVQYEATSKDGTKVPYFVVRPKNLKGPAPTILNGYGGFEISETPFYSANYGRLWVAGGGVYVLANIRGGGEFGPAWHEAALKTHRQRAFDDFAGVAADLIKRKITTPAQLGIIGGSNGGLLVSTVMTQHPELLGAVVCQVPLIDMLRYTKIKAGAGASWIGEYGDPDDPKMAAYIRTYSPYQNVSAKKTYPPVFFVTATSDDRVTPVHARKMAARMEELGHSVMFYENTDGGHAAAANHKQSAELWALSFVYLARELGLSGAPN
jgi:prolyl oligopeptidase